MSEDRLDRMEALAEQILEGLKETKQATNDLVEGLKETKQTTNNLVEGLKETKQTTNNLVEGLKETGQETRELLEGLKETKQRTDSNARAIEALTAQASEDRKQQEKDRKGIYLLLGQLTRSMSDFYHIQSDFYNRFDQIDARQADITRILQELKGDDDEENKN